MIDSVKPGLGFDELFLIGFNYVKEKYKFYERGHLGHSISMGPQTAEAPFISLSEKKKTRSWYDTLYRNTMLYIWIWWI